MKKRILVYCDSPAVETGFAQVAKNILPHLAKKYEVEVVAINHGVAWYDQTKYSYKILSPITGDLWNKELFIRRLMSIDMDYVFIINDINIIQTLLPYLKKAKQQARKENKDLKFITYTPVDHDIVQRQDLEALMEIDIPVFYTKYAMNHYNRLELNTTKHARYIYHGCESFEEITPEVRKQIRGSLGVTDDETLLIWLGRNQWRKDPLMALQILSELQKLNPAKKYKLYMHSRIQDVGGDISLMSEQLGTNVIMMQNFSEMRIDRKTVGFLYQSADAFLSTSLGEGWGLATTESMSCGIPVFVPDNSVNPELCANERGILLPRGEAIVSYGNSNAVRFRTNAKEAAKIIDETLQKPFVMSKKTKKWIEKELNWDNIGKQWLKIFE